MFDVCFYVVISGERFLDGYPVVGLAAKILSKLWDWVKKYDTHKYIQMFTNILSSPITYICWGWKVKSIYLYIKSRISQRDLQGPDNFILSKDFERENLICWRFSVYQLNTFSADSPFRFIKYY